jgi:signal transduction histidine kinase
MEDLSLHIMDVVENSIRANATLVEIRLIEHTVKDLLILEIVDNGEGMDEEMKQQCLDPFFTTKGGKNVGLGLSLLAQSAEESGGSLHVESKKGKGTKIVATYFLSHIDRKPLGNLSSTVQCLKGTHPEIKFFYKHEKINKG